MRRLEVFFDYACPYCMRGNEYLTELLPQYPDIEIVWCPCEAHPRPEQYGPHSDLCIQGMYYAREQGADMWEYHNRMYGAAIKERVNIEDPEVVTGRIYGLLDPAEFLRMLQSGDYIKNVQDGNDYAYEQSGVWAVPSYRIDGRKLDSIENVGVAKQQLAEFLRQL